MIYILIPIGSVALMVLCVFGFNALCIPGPTSLEMQDGLVHLGQAAATDPVWFAGNVVGTLVAAVVLMLVAMALGGFRRRTDARWNGQEPPYRGE
jgi:hypothetical protein